MRRFFAFGIWVLAATGWGAEQDEPQGSVVRGAGLDPGL